MFSGDGWTVATVDRRVQRAAIWTSSGGGAQLSAISMTAKPIDVLVKPLIWGGAAQYIAARADPGMDLPTINVLVSVSVKVFL